MQLTCPHCQQVLQFSGRRPTFCAYCGKPLPSPAETSTVACDPVADEGADGEPSEVGGYRLLRQIGEGGMGRVYEAEDAGGHRVAVKLISAAFAASPAAVERFRREGRLASGVSHPRCVFVLTADEAGGRPYIVMELMPGTTLQDLVDRDGPMPVEKALSKILDVIEGLQEAHRLGVVHRDVKPSNCFLDAEGRVKVGDFGLSKSLVASDALTRTGTFIGTPLFASPEQIKSEAVGPQSDVYSVAATLYCLLTGKAPFQGGDSAATLARIVSDPAPPMRSLRRELPEALDRAVLRGLERDPARRWRDLDEFRAALQAFLPGRLSFGGLGARFAAYLIDALLLMIVGFVVGLAAALLFFGLHQVFSPTAPLERMIVQGALDVALFLLYFAVPETLWGCTLGKRCLRLRVRKAAAAERPTALQAVVRAFITYLLLHLGNLASEAIILSGAADPFAPSPTQSCLISLALFGGGAVGLGLLLCPMRARNGFRGLHEWLSGTRVVRLPEPPARRRRTARDRELETSRPEGMPERLGPFEVTGALPGAASGVLLAGRDAALGRRAWIWLRPTDAPPISPTRHTLGRTTRPRWLAGGREGPYQWDAFLAPAGAPLTDAAADARLVWAEARQLLAQLAEELAAAEADGTLPPTLTTAQIWLQADGRMQLLDVAPSSEPLGPETPLDLLRDAAVLALEGKPRPAGAPPVGVRAPVPRYAARLLDRLLGIEGPGSDPPCRDVRGFGADLAAVAEKPAQTTRPRRIAHLAVLAALLLFGLLYSLGVVGALFLGTPFVLSAKIAEHQELQKRWHGVVAQDAVAALNPDLGVRIVAMRQAQEDARLDDDLSRVIERRQAERTAVVRSMSDLSRNTVTTFDEQMSAIRKSQNTNDVSYEQYPLMPTVRDPEKLRRQVEYEAATDKPMAGDANRILAIAQIVLVLFWPVVWVVWAFAFRGGLSFPLTGLALVRGNGRLALRIQCAWRALLVWAPVVGLAITAVLLNEAYWSRWPGEAPAVLLTDSSITWWAALALPLLYIVPAVWFPRRSLHDWLAGTHVVPR